jgi:hypothetical protein
MPLEKGKERNSDGWVSLLHAGHCLGLICFPFSITFFLLQYKYCMLLVGNQVLWKHQCKSLHFKSTRADVHYASASFGTTPPTYIILCLIWDSNPGPLGFKSAMLPLEPLRSAMPLLHWKSIFFMYMSHFCAEYEQNLWLMSLLHGKFWNILGKSFQFICRIIIIIFGSSQRITTDINIQMKLLFFSTKISPVSDCKFCRCVGL